MTYSGVLPAEELRVLINSKIIVSDGIKIEDAQIQPASLDLRLSCIGWEVCGEFLPTNDFDIFQFIDRYSTDFFSISDGRVLGVGKTYLIPIVESLHIEGTDLTAYCNPKSSTGRLGLSTRLVTSGYGENTGNAFDKITNRTDYRSKLFLFVTPLAFPVSVKENDTLHQMRIILGDDEFKLTHDDILYEYDLKREIVYGFDPMTTNNPDIPVGIDLEGLNSEFVGYVATRYPVEPIYINKPRTYPREYYWAPMIKPRDGIVRLDPGRFYIMASSTKVSIPPHLCGEMVPFDQTLGEFRIHHAGFFDPGFGFGNEGEVSGAHGVFEIVPHTTIFLTHGQNVASLRLEKMLFPPQKPYGYGINSNYQAQTLALAKQFI